jgi:3-methyladenine DNA glycosylase AlkD/uncharacterized protein YdhG (YjbR/CyaY superfamily)
MPPAKAKPTTIDEYLAATKPEQQAVLERLRQTIHAAAPGAEEYLGYGLAGFKLNGRPLVYFGAWPNHCALYAASPKTQGLFEEELKGFEVSKGTIRFTVEKPLPTALVRRLVQVRVAENAAMKQKRGATKKAAKSPSRVAKPAAQADTKSVLATLEKLGETRIRNEMAPRYGIVAKDAFGVPMNQIQAVAKDLGKNHALAESLWTTGCYEARLLASFVAEPGRVTPALMDRWCRDFDNWGVCDTICFHLFDRTSHAFAKIRQWADESGEFQKRAAFALLACVALHDKQAANESFLRCLPLVEAAATDERNFVKKGVSWALRAIGIRNPELRAAATKLARKLSASSEPTPRWIGKDVLRALAKPSRAPRSKSSSPDKPPAKRRTPGKPR